MRTRRLILIALAALCVLSAGAASAQAGTGYAESFSFTSPEGFNNPRGVAVDQSDGDVYVVDLGNNELKKFSVAKGKAEQLWKAEMPVPGAVPDQVAVDNYAGPDHGDAFVTGYESGAVYRFGPEGKELSPLVEHLEHPTGIAVDAAGDFFVTLEFAGTVLEFNSNGEPVDAGGLLGSENTIISGLGGVDPQAVATSSDGDEVYVAASLAGTIQYTLVGSKYVQTAIIDSAGGSGVGLAPTGDVLADEGDEGGAIAEFEPSGKLVRRFGALSYSGGVDAYGPITYASSSSQGLVDVFEEGSTPEVPVTEAATEATATTAVLHGELNPHVAARTGWYFAYNTNGTCIGGGSTPVSEVEEPVEKLKESLEATGLEPSKTYTFCIVAINKFGPEYGPPLTFRTAGAQPSVDSESATGVGASVAILEAMVNPENQETTCVRFEYGETEAYGSSAPCTTSLLGAGFGDQEASAKVTGLKFNTSYDFRVVVQNASSPVAGTHGEDQTFSTIGLIAGESFTGVGAGGALLTAQLNSYGVSTKYFFEYGPTIAYGSRTPSANTGGEGQAIVSMSVEGLAPGSEYHFRIVAEQESGSEDGADGHFTTFPSIVHGLPDGRVYEQVSRPENQGREVSVPKFGKTDNDGYNGNPTRKLFQASRSGDAVAYQGEPSSPGGNGGTALGQSVQYLATRKPAGGWTQVSLQPPGYLGIVFQAFSSELATAVLDASSQGSEADGDYLPPLASSAPAVGDVLYARNLGEERYQPLFTTPSPNRGAGLEAYNVSRDGQVPKKVPSWPTLVLRRMVAGFSLRRMMR